MNRETTAGRKVLTLTWTSFVVGATAGALTTLGSYVRREIRRRGYPAWDRCRCDFKSQPTFFQVWHSQHQRRGETIFAEEWGILLSNPPQWLRRLLHHSSQVAAALNPRGNYVERVALSPQEAPRAPTRTPARAPAPTVRTHVVWKREILYAPRHFFDKCIRRLYPTHISQERIATAQPLPALWDPQSNLPLPTEGELLETPLGTRIDCIGWTPSQISYCTVRTKEEREESPL
jgi:hypothetical protein